VLDTGDARYFSNSNVNFRRLRNTIMHEQGHGMGLLHIESNTDEFLMEPFINVAFDGPQFDDIRGIQAFYGDVFEKDNDGRGNDSSDLATELGPIEAGETVSIGTAAGPDRRVLPTDVDFVSIDHFTDADYFSFGVSGPSTLDAVLAPLGGTFNQAVEGGFQSPFDSTAISDLALDIFGTDGTSVLATSNTTGAGEAESLLNVNLPAAGEYRARVTGAADNIQFYQLDLSVTAVDASLNPTADFDRDGDVDGDDLLELLLGFGTVGAGPEDGDADFDGRVDRGDLFFWHGQAGGAAADGLAANGAVPEPASLILLAMGLAALGTARWSNLRARQIG
jgi:hypothetical protein